MFHSISMTSVASTFSDALGIEKPIEANDAIDLVKDLRETHVGGTVERVFVYNPDAIGSWLFQKYTNDFAPVLKNTQLGVPVKTVMPSVTPVCFGTMYTGVEPAVHGIQAYEKKLITTDSLFDAVVRAGKKAAIVAVAGSSMSVIFRERNIDYYILPYDQEVNEKALELIKEDQYDLLVVYNQEYDDTMHRTGTESEESINAMHNHIEAFDMLASAVKENWKKHDTMICWATDHGIHQLENGHGWHGDDIEEDMNVMHFYGIYPKEK